MLVRLLILVLILNPKFVWAVANESSDVNLLMEAKRYIDLALDKEIESPENIILENKNIENKGSNNSSVSPDSKSERNNSKIAEVGKSIEYFEPMGNITDTDAIADKNKIIRQMFSSESKDLQWPALPRAWVEKSILEQRNFNKSLGLQLNPFRVGFKIKDSKSEFYSLKTSVVIASSLKVNINKSKIKINGDSFDYHYILIKDDKNKQIYPNVTESHPMVGFCTFEVKYSTENSEFTETSFFGSNIQSDHIKALPIVYLFTSKVFQVDKKISIRTYMHSYCGTIFREQIESKVLADFQKIKSEIDSSVDLHNNSKLVTRVCEPQPKINGMWSNISDDNCVLWHESTFKKSIVDRTIARCEKSKTSTQFECKLYSKEGVRCPIYWDVKNKKYTSEYEFRKTIPSTNGLFENPCDSQSQLKCVFEEKPTLLLGVPFFLGKGICARI